MRNTRRAGLIRAPDNVSVAVIILLAAIVGGIAGIACFAIARRRPVQATPSHTQSSDDLQPDDFANLSEAERCDLMFACAALEDDGSLDVLERALDDSSESVAVAAARAMVRRGRTSALTRYFASRNDERSRRIAATLELLG